MKRRGAWAAILLCSVACNERGRQASVGPPPSANASAKLEDCASITRQLDAEYARLARIAVDGWACTRDADCACYGGPVCPNALVKSCPAPIGKGAYRMVAPLEARWRGRGCGDYLWSPDFCEARCAAGHCASADR